MPPSLVIDILDPGGKLEAPLRYPKRAYCARSTFILRHSLTLAQVSQRAYMRTPDSRARVASTLVALQSSEATPTANSRLEAVKFPTP
jgi:hypothetical protein